MSRIISRYKFDPKESYTSLERRELLFQNLCKHLAKGYTMHSFGHKKIIPWLLKEYEHEGWQDIIDEAMAAGQKMLEGIGLDYLTGKLEGKFHEKTWQFFMSRRYKPDWGDTPEQISPTAIIIYHFTSLQFVLITFSLDLHVTYQ